MNSGGDAEASAAVGEYDDKFSASDTYFDEVFRVAVVCFVAARTAEDGGCGADHTLR